MNSRSALLVVALSLGLSACGKKEEAPASGKSSSAKASASSGHCMLEDKKCWEFPSPDSARTMASMCSGHGKVVENELCPTAGVVASCKSDSMKVRYYEGDRPGNCPACPDGKFPAWTKQKVAEECRASQQTLE